MLFRSVDLENVKVPRGMEDFHRALISSYGGERAAYEEIMATLEPGGAHAEGDGEEHGGKESSESHAEESPQETVPVEEKPAEGGGH